MNRKSLRRSAFWGLLLHFIYAPPLWAQVAFPARAVEVVNALYKGVDPQNDDARRAKIVLTCEQLAHDLGPSWGGKKRAGLSDAFRSPDSIAFLEADGSVSVWDIQASSGQILVTAGKPPDHPRLSPSDAAFMPCAPVNHLGAPLPNPGPIVPDLGMVEKRLDALEAANEVYRAVLSDVQAKADALLGALSMMQRRIEELQAGFDLLASRPVYAGCRASVFGIPVSCRLEK